MQRLFVMTKLMDPSGIDGSFGPVTEQAVKDFQSGSGLVADGVVGPLTWAALPPDPETIQLWPGAIGPVVTVTQAGLLAYGGPGSPTDPGPADGIFGPNTESAVRAYQAAVGVAVDGIVGDRTWWAPSGGAGATLASLSTSTTV